MLLEFRVSMGPLCYNDFSFTTLSLCPFTGPADGPCFRQRRVYTKADMHFHDKVTVMRTMMCLLFLGLLGAGLVPCVHSESGDSLIEDFERADYGNWQVEGTAFGPGPARGTLPDQMRVTGYQGRRLVNSYYGGDDATGSLTSPPFIVERAYINFLIGGGGHGDKTAVMLLHEGRPVRVSSGPNTEPGGSETLKWTHWEVSELMNKEVQIKIVDEQTGTWGHINADHFVQSDAPLVQERTKELLVEKRYLNLPVKNGAPKKWVRLLKGDILLREFDIELAPADPDFWVFLELTPFTGEALTLQADEVERDSKGFDTILQSDEILGGENLYREKYRPQYHFSAKRGWLNDPNGLVYYAGEYHLFFQHNPYGWNWGNMTWGHAVSSDLVHWEELGDALHPDELGTIFSGSAVVDWHNTTGFQSGDEPPLVCIFTYAGGNTPWSKDALFTQGIAYSNDRGRTWTKYAGNPVQGHIIGGNRDPKVIWHEPTQQWVIVLFLDEKRMAFFTSADLKEWKQTSEMEACFECPDLFSLPIKDDVSREKWILYGASGEYFVGEFNGETFKPDGDALPFNYGDCFYASQTFNDIPPEDGRRIQIAWGRTGHPDMPFNQMMNFPVELTLRDTENGLRLFAWPVREIETLHREAHSYDAFTLDNASKTFAYDTELLDVQVRLDNFQTSEFGLEVCGLVIAYDPDAGELRCGDKKAPLPLEDGKMELRLLVDRLSVEIFANGGRVYMPMAHKTRDFPSEITLSTREGSAAVSALSVHELAPVWTPAQG